MHEVRRTFDSVDVNQRSAACKNSVVQTQDELKGLYNVLVQTGDSLRGEDSDAKHSAWIANKEESETSEVLPQKEDAREESEKTECNEGDSASLYDATFQGVESLNETERAIALNVSVSREVQSENEKENHPFFIKEGEERRDETNDSNLESAIEGEEGYEDEEFEEESQDEEEIEILGSNKADAENSKEETDAVELTQDDCTLNVSSDAFDTTEQSAGGERGVADKSSGNEEDSSSLSLSSTDTVKMAVECAVAADAIGKLNLLELLQRKLSHDFISTDRLANAVTKAVDINFASRSRYAYQNTVYKLVFFKKIPLIERRQNFS